MHSGNMGEFNIHQLKLPAIREALFFARGIALALIFAISSYML